MEREVLSCNSGTGVEAVDQVDRIQTHTEVQKLDSGCSVVHDSCKISEADRRTPTSDGPNFLLAAFKASQSGSADLQDLDSSSHASSQQEGADRGALRDLWRDGTKILDNPGDRGPPVGVEGGTRHGHSERQAAHSDAPHDDCPEQSQQEEGRLARVRDADPAGPHQWNRDHPDASEGRSQEDLHDLSRNGRGPCGFWRTLQPAVPGVEDTAAQVCCLGDQNLPGRDHRLPPGTPGRMADESRGQSAGGEEDSGDLERIQQHISRDARQDGPDDGSDDGDDAEPQGGCGQSESGTASQEGRDIQCFGDDRFVSRLFHGCKAVDPSVTVSGSRSVSEVDATFHGCWESLPEAKGRHLAFCKDRLIPETFESLLSHRRIELLEVACAPNSVLSQVMQQKKGADAARRCSIFNEYDLGTNQGIHKVIADIDHYNPKHVWMSPICGPFSVMQNINQRTEQQVADLEQKRKNAIKQYTGCALIYTYCIQKGIHVTWEWSQSCQAWRLPLMQNLVKRFQPFFAVIRGCRVNLVTEKGIPISKGWKIMTTHALLAKRMDLPCKCEKHRQHEKCEGSLTNKTAYYTKEFAHRVCDAIIQGQDNEPLRKELMGEHQLGDHFGNGTCCNCEHKEAKMHSLTCGSCVHEKHAIVLGDNPQGEVLAGDDNPQMGQQLGKEEIRRKLYLLHASTGHGPVRHLIQALRRRGVSQEIIQEAEKFECSVCKERGRPKPRPFSTLEPHPPKWATVSGDVGHWEHPHTGVSHQFLMFVDEGSRFRVGRMVLEGKKAHVNAPQFLEVFRESWVQYFGYPNQLRLDPDGTFRSSNVSEFCDRHQIFLDLTPGEAHWKLGICEQSIQGTKQIMSKLAEEHPDITAAEALAEATRAFNSRDLLRGYSPIQHALGRAPDVTGRLFPCGDNPSPDLLIENASGEMGRQLQRMATAEKAFLDWTCQQRLIKAKNSKPRDVTQYEPGDLVYIWRKQVSGKAAVKGGSFVGPCRVLAIESHVSPDGTRKQGSSIWCVRGRRLLKCSPEQLRRASDREVLLEELHHKQYDDWDFDRVAKQLGGNEFLDVSSEIPSQEEWERAQDPLFEWQPSQRIRQKRGPLPEELPGRSPEQPSSSSSRPGRSRSPASRATAGELPAGPSPAQRPRTMNTESFEAAPPWWETKLVQEQFAAENNCFWMDESAAVSVEIEMPNTKSASERAIRDLPAYFTGALKRRASIEINEKHLTPEELQQFRSAKAVEVNNFIAAKAFEALPDSLKPARNQAIKMRWILCWKHKEDGSKKAKARAVLLGYQDPCYEQRATTSPTTTRQTRQLQLQLAAAFKHKMRKGDVTGAFLQSRPYPGELFCIPCPEILEKMNLPAESITRVKRACYGLVDAPLEWYRSICHFFQKLGLQRCWSDACCWLYIVDGVTKGVISGHVDDFLFSGDDNHNGWKNILNSIREEYKWGDWEEGQFTQCGVQVEQHEDFSFSLSQCKYVEDLKYINIRAFRKKDRTAETDDHEKTQLRALLGGISWHAQQVAPHFSAEVGLMLSEVGKSTIDTIFRANKILDKVKEMKDHKLRVHCLEPHDIMLYVWVDAASQNRVDGSSTQGIIVGASSKRLLHGDCDRVTFLTWHSQKISRVCRSPGASEAAAAVNGEDYLYFARFQLSEMLGHPVQVRNVNEVVNKVDGCLVTDSRNVFDKVETEVLSIKGAEKRTDLELLALKSSQWKNGVIIRWVHSEAQLSNGLTKAGELRQLLMFYQMGHKWRIVEDEERASARKRKLAGLSPLENRKASKDLQE